MDILGSWRSCRQSVVVCDNKPPKSNYKVGIDQSFSNMSTGGVLVQRAVVTAPFFLHTGSLPAFP